MTKKFTFALMSGALILGASLASCSNESAEPTPAPAPSEGHMLVKSPEMIAYSKGKALGEYGTRAEDLVEDEAEAKPYVSMNDVEINLTVNDESPELGENEEGETFSKDYISTHLSIHVRTARDVKITIPVPVDYYCEVDDMAIVKKHLSDHFVYGDQSHTLSMNIAGTTVTATVDYAEDGFTITTSGINEEVMEYLAEEYGDGLTFEIWNYYNDSITREDLREILNQSTVEFVDGDSNVDYYINAFSEINGVANPWDCTVSPVEFQAGNFGMVEPGSQAYWETFHGYNGSSLNKVYVHKPSKPLPPPVPVY